MRRLAGVGCVYIPVDYDPILVGVLPMDVRNLEFEDCSFDVALCSHVLEHVRNERPAMTELFRVLRPGGLLFAQVPYEGDTTAEFDEVDAHGHVRMYGREDFMVRLADVGFAPVETENLSGSSDAPHQFDTLDLFVAIKPGQLPGAAPSRYLRHVSDLVFGRAGAATFKDVARKPVAT